MTKTTHQPASPTLKRSPRVHKNSPAALNASVLQRKNLKSRLKAKVRQKMLARFFEGRRVHFDNVVRVTRMDGGREVRCLKVPFTKGKPVAVDEKHTDWLRGLRTRPLQPKNKRVEMWHTTSRAAARMKAFSSKKN